VSGEGEDYDSCHVGNVYVGLNSANVLKLSCSLDNSAVVLSLTVTSQQLF